MKPAVRAERSVARSRLVMLNASAALAMLTFTVLFATLFVRSYTGASYFTRLEYCSICGAEQFYREVSLLDHRVLRSTSRRHNGISKVLGRSRTNPCGHAFHTIHEKMSHLSAKTTPKLLRREKGNVAHANVLENKRYIAALASIESTNPVAAQLIWTRTLSHTFKENRIPIREIHAALRNDNPVELQAFLQTNRFFRPRQANPEKFFNQLPAF